MVAGDWVEIIIKLLALVFVLLTGFAYLTLFERRVLAAIQSRVGPDRVGPKGFLQPAADGLKLLFKEDIIPRDADRLLFMIAPIAVVITALMSVAVVPWGPDMTLFGREVSLALADINIGTLFFLGIGSLAVYGVVLAGWASNNKYALMGGIRASAQMLSYELAMGLAVVGVVMLAASMSLGDIVDAQAGGKWFILLQPLGFIIFIITMLAETKRAPFDLPEAEQELVAGFHTEYSGMKFAMFYMGEYISMIVISAVAATLYLGGWRGPFVDALPILGPIYLIIKIILILFFFVWVRATLPRVRYDRLMSIGWKILLPLSVLNVALTAIGIVAADTNFFGLLG
ncbi:MAG: NADH-quinone oxidoreductase subunit NuoH [Anaerolineales bacterium]|nr:NADH-quinone oxidoreductase subunit NuoH [Anaerolineales bacterium]MCB9128746.1 NADH-quinone oxidoreductase subunit NuoH [Ardenticatenales bacterium]